RTPLDELHQDDVPLRQRESLDPAAQSVRHIRAVLAGRVGYQFERRIAVDLPPTGVLTCSVDESPLGDGVKPRNRRPFTWFGTPESAGGVCEHVLCHVLGVRVAARATADVSVDLAIARLEPTIRWVGRSFVHS